MSTVDDAYYNQDCARVMATISKTFASNAGAPTEHHQDVIDAGVAAIAALDGAGQTAPADLQTVTDNFVQGVKDSYIAQRDEFDALIALPTEALDALGHDVARLGVLRGQCNDWVVAIDAEWTPGA